MRWGKMFGVSILAVFLAATFILAGCGNEKITREYTLNDRIKIVVDVPREEDNFKKMLEDEESEDLMYYPVFYQGVLGTKNTYFFVRFDNFEYQTHISFEKDHPEMDKKNPNFDDMLKVVASEEKRLDINGAKASKRALKERGKLAGYVYRIDAKDPKGYVSILVVPKDRNADVDALMGTEEVKGVIDSAKVINTAKK